jgi:hypothetical protein
VDGAPSCASQCGCACRQEVIPLDYKKQKTKNKKKTSFFLSLTFQNTTGELLV